MSNFREQLNALRDEYTQTRDFLKQLAREGKVGTKEYKKIRKYYEELGKKFDELLYPGKNQ